MSDGILFKETSAWMDTVDLALCLFIYEVCNDCQFGHLSGSDFVQRCGISKSYYDKHRNDVCAQGATKENREYRKSIDRAIEKARQLNYTP